MAYHQHLAPTPVEFVLDFFQFVMNVWMQRFLQRFGTLERENHSPHEPNQELQFSIWSLLLVSVSFSLRWAWEKTMVGCKRWWRRLCYSSSMACHCACYAFLLSQKRDFLNKTKFKPSFRSSPVFLSSINNTGVSYNPLVSEVLINLFFLISMLNMQCASCIHGNVA